MVNYPYRSQYDDIEWTQNLRGKYLNGNTLRSKRWHSIPSTLMDESAQIVCLEHVGNILPVMEAMYNVAPVIDF